MYDVNSLWNICIINSTSRYVWGKLTPRFLSEVHSIPVHYRRHSIKYLEVLCAVIASIIYAALVAHPTAEALFCKVT